MFITISSNKPGLRCPSLSIPTNGGERVCDDTVFPKFTQQFPLAFCFIAYTVITCSPLVPPTDGSVSPLSCLSMSNYNQTCRLTCSRPGYSLIGTSSRTCVSDGRWTGSNDTRCTGELLNPLRAVQFPSFIFCRYFNFHALLKLQTGIPTTGYTDVIQYGGKIVPHKGPFYIYLYLPTTSFSRVTIFKILNANFDQIRLLLCKIVRGGQLQIYRLVFLYITLLKKIEKQARLTIFKVTYNILNVHHSNPRLPRYESTTVRAILRYLIPN